MLTPFGHTEVNLIQVQPGSEFFRAAGPPIGWNRISLKSGGGGLAGNFE
jgi:hypothetical protein